MLRILVIPHPTREYPYGNLIFLMLTAPGLVVGWQTGARVGMHCIGVIRSHHHWSSEATSTPETTWLMDLSSWSAQICMLCIMPTSFAPPRGRATIGADFLWEDACSGATVAVETHGPPLQAVLRARLR